MTELGKDNVIVSDDRLFGCILILGFVLVFPVSLYYRLKSQASKEKLDRRKEGLFILFTLRPIALMRMLGLVAFVIDPAWMAWSSIQVPLWLRWLGVGLGAGAAGLLMLTYKSLGTNLTDTVVTRAHHTLVTTGPYRWVRHPFYVAFAMSVMADSVVTANGFLGLTGATLLGLLAIRTPTEERMLVERFGDAYRDYMSRTGRFIPRPMGR